MTDLSAPLVRYSSRRTRLPGRVLAARAAGAALAAVAGTVALTLPLLKPAPAPTPPLAPTASVQATITPDPDMLPLDAVPLPGTPQSSFTVLDPLAIEPDMLDGNLPRVSDAGIRPFDLYARPVVETGRPRIAIVVSGMGLNAAGTSSAINSLPEAVTLAFAPYGDDLPDITADARAAGHEIFLEVPLESFSGSGDPPDTLRTGRSAGANLEGLRTLLGRFAGYAAVINNMGARFTASEPDFAPVMAELGSRGLGYLDDGASSRSLAGQLAAPNNVPFGRASASLDLDPSRNAIALALGRLESEASRTGGATGIIMALPDSIAAISEWAAGLEARGFELVPATALMGDD